MRGRDRPLGRASLLSRRRVQNVRMPPRNALFSSIQFANISCWGTRVHLGACRKEVSAEVQGIEFIGKHGEIVGEWLGELFSASDSLTALLWSPRETACWALLSAQRLYFPTRPEQLQQIVRGTNQSPLAAHIP